LSIRDPDIAARKLIEIANCRTAASTSSASTRFSRGTGSGLRADIERAIALGWLWRHESGTYVRFTQAGADLFAQMKPSTEAALVLSAPILSSTSRPPSMKSRPCLGLFRQPDPSCRNDHATLSVGCIVASAI
jgi:hypothetical protein